MRWNELTADETATTTPLTYVLTLGITTVLIAGLIAGASGAIEDQQRTSVERQLTVVGERLANEITGVDRLVYTSSKSTITLKTTHPTRVVGSRYSIEMKNGGPPCQQNQCIVLNSTSPAVTVTVSYTTDATVEERVVRGGPVSVNYNTSTRNITIEER
ncbi:hypothetical protein ACFQJC_10310 [Haloferax namakaokahaiae]|uniref:Uncharacterized protein n=1 Tax=Haloferax namakaokahaiae TaxID=1748331 RepID=A0ABD5ZF72_9EURY